MLHKMDQNTERNERKNVWQFAITSSILFSLIFQNDAYKLDFYKLGFRRCVYLANRDLFD